MWIEQNAGFAVCPITEGALVRYIMRTSDDGAKVARQTMNTVSQISGYNFWPDEISYGTLDLRHISGHKQVTDAYLVALANSRQSRLATFDSALATVHKGTQYIA